MSKPAAIIDEKAARERKEHIDHVKRRLDAALIEQKHCQQNLERADAAVKFLQGKFDELGA